MEVVSLFLIGRQDTDARLELAGSFGRSNGARLRLARTGRPTDVCSYRSVYAAWDTSEGGSVGSTLKLKLDPSSELSFEAQLGNDGPVYSAELLNRPAGSSGAIVGFGWSKTAQDTQFWPSIHLSIPLDSPGMRVYSRIGSKTQELGLAFGLDVTRLNVGAELSERGLALMLRMRHRKFSMSLPVMVSESLDSDAVLVCVVAPVLAYSLWRLCFSAASQSKRNEERQRALHIKLERLETKRSLALQQQDLVRSDASEIRASELSASGLVLLSAEYRVEGVSDALQRKAKERGPLFATSLDVKVPLQFWVSSSTLELPARSKAGMLGFYPLFDFGKRLPRRLFMQYSFQGVVHECIVDDNAPVHLPNPLHRSQS